MVPFGSVRLLNEVFHLSCSLQLHDQGIKAIADARDKYVALAIQALGPLNEKRQRRATIADLDRDLQSHRIQEQRAQMGIASGEFDCTLTLAANNTH